MNTYSHFIVTAVLRKPINRRTLEKPARWPPLRTSALLLGSVIPDIPLTAVAIFAIVRDMLMGAFERIDFEQLDPGMPPPPEWLDISMTMRLFEVWFFENPWMITGHHLFHSPLLVGVYIVVAYWLWRRGVQKASWFFWLSCAAMFHTWCDIPLHVTDGPLLLFPLNWTWRYISPISYWDPNYYGREWSYFEHILDVVLLFYLLWLYRQPMRGWFQRRFAKAQPAV